MIFFFGALVGLAIGLWSVGGLLKYRREQQKQLSDGWRLTQQRSDLIQNGQYDGYVQFPWSGDYDDAA